MEATKVQIIFFQISNKSIANLNHLFTEEAEDLVNQISYIPYREKAARDSCYTQF